jgi:hypothetical protein
MGRRGRVEAILTVLMGAYTQVRQQFIRSRDSDMLCLVRVRENRFRAHIAIEASRISATNAQARLRVTANGTGLFCRG